MTKAAIERERAELKLKLAKIEALSSTPLRVVIMTHSEMMDLFREINNLSGAAPRTERKAAK